MQGDRSEEESVILYLRWGVLATLQAIGDWQMNWGVTGLIEPQLKLDQLKFRIAKHFLTDHNATETTESSSPHLNILDYL